MDSDSAQKKAKIPRALREQVWRTHAGTVFETKCIVKWCSNRITAFDFEVGHNIPESRGGATEITNLRPICGRCNKSMGNRYTITQWDDMSQVPAVARTGCCW